MLGGSLKAITGLKMGCKRRVWMDLFIVLVGLRMSVEEVNPPVTVMTVILIEPFPCKFFLYNYAPLLFV